MTALQRLLIAKDLTVQDVRAQLGDAAARLVEESFDAHFGRARQLDAAETGPGLLTSDEAEAIRTAGQLWGLLTSIVGDGETREADLAELIAPIHLIQRYIGSQALARQLPHEFRALGEVLTPRPTTRGERP